MTALSLAMRSAINSITRDTFVVVSVFAIAGFGLIVESTVTTLTQQNILSALAWCVLLCLLKGESVHTRIQVAVVICVAVNAEILFALHWHFFAYRFNNIPAFVPPGHGLLYMAALAMSRSVFFRRHQGKFTLLALSLGTVWAVWNVLLAERSDVGGAILFAVLFVFIVIGRTHPLYVAAFFITAYLELIGTSFHNWEWASQWPFFGLSQANPPCGISAGYCIFDAIGVGGAALIQKIRRFVAERFWSNDLDDPLLDEAEAQSEQQSS